MSNFLRLGFFSLSLVISACSITPSTEDVTGLPTPQIAHRVRCETRLAIRDNLLQYLEYMGNPENKGDPAYLALAQVVKTGSPAQVKDALYNGVARDVVTTLANTAIAYDFSFTATENNKFDPTLGLTDIFRRGSLSGSPSGAFDRSRQNIETFLLADSFIDLLLAPPTLPCDKDEIIYAKNFTYPLTGNVGIGKLVNNFNNLYLFEHLTGKDKDKPRSYGAELTFSTTLSLSGTPQLTLSPVGMGVHVLNASLGLAASRTDIHVLTIGFALAPPAPPPPPSPAPTPEKKGAGAVAPPPAVQPLVVYPGLFVEAVADTPAKALAKHTVDQTILRFQVGGRNGNTLIVPFP